MNAMNQIVDKYLADTERTAGVIRDFRWSNYGLDDIGELTEDPGTQDWIADLALAIEDARRGQA